MCVAKRQLVLEQLDMRDLLQGIDMHGTRITTKRLQAHRRKFGGCSAAAEILFAVCIAVGIVPWQPLFAREADSFGNGVGRIEALMVCAGGYDDCLSGALVNDPEFDALVFEGRSRYVDVYVADELRVVSLLAMPLG
jgi:hypothetical protein